MEKIFIKYNPYKKECEVESALPTNFRGDLSKGRFQEKIGDFCNALKDELRGEKTLIQFYGTEIDYEDLEEAIINSKIKNVTLDHVKTVELVKQEKLDEIIHKIENCPFEEIKENTKFSDVITQIKEKTIKIAIIATMSSGKSTLINALLEKKLMPTANRACTAFVTEIRDTDVHKYSAKIFRSNGMEEINDISQDILLKRTKEENGELDTNDENNKELHKIKKIEIEGDIPFVSAEDVNLTLIDTPGINNATNDNHRKLTHDLLDNSSMGMILFVTTPDGYQTNDNNEFFDTVAEKIKTDGKIINDKVLFILNKVDNLKKDNDETVENSTEDFRDYLVSRDIQNPKIFPISAEAAFLIKDILVNKNNKGYADFDEAEDSAYSYKRKFNREIFELDNFASSSSYVNKNIQEQLKEADDAEKAYIHTGIPSLELTIKEYTEKYAKAENIFEMVTRFNKILEDERIEDQIKSQISSNVESRKEIEATIKLIKEEIADKNKIEDFKIKINRIDIDSDLRDKLEEKRTDFQKQINVLFNEKINKNMTSSSIRYGIASLKEEIKKYQEELNLDVTSLINNELRQRINFLYQDYRERVKKISKDLYEKEGINVEVLTLMENISFDEAKINKAIKDKTVMVKNENRRWYKLSTWFEPKYIYITKANSDINALYQNIIASLEEELIKNTDEIMKYMQNTSKRIKEDFLERFEEFDKAITDKMRELERYGAEKRDKEHEKKKLEKKLKWIKEIQGELENIITI